MATQTVDPKNTIIGVVGAGNMGSGIAQKYATEGFQVVVVDINEESVQRGKERVTETLNEGVERKVFKPEKRDAILANMTFTADKTKLKGMLKESSYDIATLKQSYGLKTDAVWFEAFDDAPGRDVNYLRKMRNNGEKLNEGPRITLSTIHGAKGGESQNVVLLTDLSENTMKAYEKNADDENRLFYVGATRTKEHLHIISPKQEYKGYKI